MASTSHNPFYAAMQPQAQHWGATSPTSTGAGYDRPSAGYPAYTGYAAAGTSHPAPSSSSPSMALALYNPSSLYGLYYNEAVHGPFATGLQSNPFTPGLAPLSTVSRPSYATEDPLRQRYPATSANPHDPLNWITEDLFAIRMEREAISQQRTPLRSASVAAR